MQLVRRLRTYDLGHIIFYGWKTSIALTLLGMTLSLLLFGFFYPYWRFADQDLVLAYQGLLFNDGRTQQYFDHTGYLYYLVIGVWYRVAHWLGVLPVYALSLLPSSADVVAFEAAWQRLIQVGRVLSLVLAGLFVCTFAALVRRLVGDWRIAAVAAFALAYSGGVALHTRVMRTELLSAGLATIALLLVLVAARESQIWRRPIWLSVAALCAGLAVIAKVQVIFLVAAIPAIALMFGQRASDQNETSRSAGWLVAGAFVILALAAGVPASALFLKGFAPSANAIWQYQPLGGVADGTYQAIIVLLVIAAMAAYAAVWRVALPDVLAAMAAVALGVSLALLSLYIRFHEQNLLATTHPIEHLQLMAAAGIPELLREGRVLNQELVANLLRGIGTALAKHTFVLSTSSRPTLMLEWLAIAGAIVLWRRGERRLPLQVALLVLVVWGMDTIFTLRGIKLEYFVYGDPLLILAAALVATRFPELLTSQRALKIGLWLAAISIVWSHLEPVKPLLSRKTPSASCEWLPNYLKEVEPFPFCRS